MFLPSYLFNDGYRHGMGYRHGHGAVYGHGDVLLHCYGVGPWDRDRVWPVNGVWDGYLDEEKFIMLLSL